MLLDRASGFFRPLPPATRASALQQEGGTVQRRGVYRASMIPCRVACLDCTQLPEYRMQGPAARTRESAKSPPTGPWSPPIQRASQQRAFPTPVAVSADMTAVYRIRGVAGRWPEAAGYCLGPWDRAPVGGRNSDQTTQYSTLRRKDQRNENTGVARGVDDGSCQPGGNPRGIPLSLGQVRGRRRRGWPIPHLMRCGMPDHTAPVRVLRHSCRSGKSRTPAVTAPNQKPADPATRAPRRVGGQECRMEQDWTQKG
jgi:hypothetical protein